MLRPLAMLLILVVAAILLAILVSGAGWLGEHEGPGVITAVARPAESVAARSEAQRRDSSAIGRSNEKQILFGDLHVHTTLSMDAFMLSLPLTQGEGAHPQADACDFARFCSALDFWSINDHAEGYTPQQWQETVESIRQCNEVAAQDGQPDTVAFLGWEWTQVGATPEDHYGHKNVVVAGLDDANIPTRPIASRGVAGAAMSGPGILARGALALSAGGGRMQDFSRFLAERASYEGCPDDVHVRELPDDCVESAPDPGVLFRKLDEWGFESLVIPHGTSWGFYTPPGSTWRKQLTKEHHDPDRQALVEIFSGHGNSEQYRDWRAVEYDDAGLAHCPEPRPDYMPSCWRAGEIIRERCEAEGLADDECAQREVQAREYAAQAGVAGHITVPGEAPDDWLDAGQCRDCFLPAFNHRPGSSVQYMMAIRNFDDPTGPERFRFGFMGSSDIHFARPGTGYKEIHRRGMTESRNVGRSAATSFVQAPEEPPIARAKPFLREENKLQGFQLVEMERQASFFLTGGLVAAHSTGRDRGAIWSALERKEVYGTSGPRILLWFDLLNPSGSETRVPMGSSSVQTHRPRFRVTAVGSFEQKPGCPDYATSALTPERLEHVCKGECYYPSDQRRIISRVEVVKIRPQSSADEEIAGLIEDPWRVFECAPDSAGCRVLFEDPDFEKDGRDSVYYVRAIEAPSMAINAGNLRCERDESGSCLTLDPCGTAETVGDDCLAETEERAWSSPIFVDWGSGPRS